MDLNSYNVIGRVTREIGEKDFSYTTNGKAKLNISIAVNDGYGERQSVSFFDVTIWGKPAESLKPYITKGKQLGINGRLKQDRWEKDGRNYSKVYIVAESVQLLGGKSEGSQNNGGENVSYEGGEDFPEDLPF